MLSGHSGSLVAAWRRGLLTRETLLPIEMAYGIDKTPCFLQLSEAVHLDRGVANNTQKLLV